MQLFQNVCKHASVTRTSQHRSTPLVSRPIIVFLRRQDVSMEPSTSGRGVISASSNKWQRNTKSGLSRQGVMMHSSETGDGAPVYSLPPVLDLKAEKDWLEVQMREWLNEEWPAPTTVEVHARLAEAIATTYMKARASGQDDLSDVLLALTTELSSSFNFFDTFTDPFEVSNKATEVLMMRDGADVCCAHEADKARVGRVSEEFWAGRS